MEIVTEQFYGNSLRGHLMEIVTEQFYGDNNNHPTSEPVSKWPSLENELLADQRERDARDVYKKIISQDRPDVAVAIILRSIDTWYKKGLEDK